MEIPLCCVLKQECILSSQLESAGSLRSADPLLLHCHRVEFLHLINSRPFSSWFASKINQQPISAWQCPAAQSLVQAGVVASWRLSGSPWSIVLSGDLGDMPLSTALAQSFLSSCLRLDGLQLESCGRLGPFVTHIFFFSLNLMKTQGEHRFVDSSVTLWWLGISISQRRNFSPLPEERHKWVWKTCSVDSCEAIVVCFFVVLVC